MVKDVNEKDDIWRGYNTAKNPDIAEPKTRRVAIASFVLALFPWLFSQVLYTGPLSRATFVLCIDLPWLLSIVTGVSALIMIKREKPALKGRKLAIAGICITIISVFLILVAGRNLNRIIYAPASERIACANNMTKLGQAFQNYAEGHAGQLPTASQWCDLLIKEAAVVPETFICPCSVIEGKQSSYALNKNVIGFKLADIPRDVVLLFESIPGWNQVGGAELLATECHRIASFEDCNVLLAGGGVKTCKREEIHKLRWKE